MGTQKNGDTEKWGQAEKWGTDTFFANLANTFALKIAPAKKGCLSPFFAQQEYVHAELPNLETVLAARTERPVFPFFKITCLQFSELTER